MTHFGVIQHSSLTGGFLESFGLSPEISTKSPIDVIKESGFDLGSLKLAFDTIRIQNKPKVSFDLFDRVRENLSGAFQIAGEQRELLGQASVDISKALGEQVTIRETQRAETLGLIGEINKRLSGQVTALGETGKGLDPLKFLTDNPLLLGLSAGGIAVGAIVLIILLK